MEERSHSMSSQPSPGSTGPAAASSSVTSETSAALLAMKNCRERTSSPSSAGLFPATTTNAQVLELLHGSGGHFASSFEDEDSPIPPPKVVTPPPSAAQQNIFVGKPPPCDLGPPEVKVTPTTPLVNPPPTKAGSTTTNSEAGISTMSSAVSAVGPGNLTAPGTAARAGKSPTCSSGGGSLPLVELFDTGAPSNGASPTGPLPPPPHLATRERAASCQPALGNTTPNNAALLMSPPQHTVPTPWQKAAQDAALNSPGSPQPRTTSQTSTPLTPQFTPMGLGGSFAGGSFAGPGSSATRRAKKKPPALVVTPQAGPAAVVNDAPPMMALPDSAVPAASANKPAPATPGSTTNSGVLSPALAPQQAGHGSNGGSSSTYASPTSPPPPGWVYFTNSGRVLNAGPYSADDNGCRTLTNHLMFNSSFSGPPPGLPTLGPTMANPQHGSSTGHHHNTNHHHTLPSSGTSTASGKHFNAVMTSTGREREHSQTGIGGSRGFGASVTSPQQANLMPGGTPTMDAAGGLHLLHIPATPPLKSTNMEEPLSPIAYTRDVFPSVEAAAAAQGQSDCVRNNVSSSQSQAPPSATGSPHHQSAKLTSASLDLTSPPHPQKDVSTPYGSLGIADAIPPWAAASSSTAKPLRNDSIASAASVDSSSGPLLLPPSVPQKSEDGDGKAHPSGRRGSNPIIGGIKSPTGPTAGPQFSTTPSSQATFSPKLSPAMSSQALTPQSLGGMPYQHRALLSMSDLEIVNVIDAGASGTVHKACLRETGRLFAVKRIDLSNLHTWSYSHSFDQRPPPKIRQMHSIVHRELKMLHSEYRSAHVVKTYNAFYCSKEESLDIVMEFMDYGSLERLGHLMSPTHMRAPLPERVLAVVAEQVLLGMRDMHSRGHIHRDVKPTNILINAGGIVKLSDFGLSESTTTIEHSDAEADEEAGFCSGTDLFMSPERQRGEPHGPPCDIWALGLTLAECAVGKYPIDLSRCRDEFERMELMSRGPVYPSTVVQNLSENFKDFVNKCMAKNAKDRPTAVELLEHKLFMQWKGTFNFREFLKDRVRFKQNQKVDVARQRENSARSKHNAKHKFEEDFGDEFEYDEYGEPIDEDEIYEARGHHVSHQTTVGKGHHRVGSSGSRQHSSSVFGSSSSNSALARQANVRQNSTSSTRQRASTVGNTTTSSAPSSMMCSPTVHTVGGVDPRCAPGAQQMAATPPAAMLSTSTPLVLFDSSSSLAKFVDANSDLLADPNSSVTGGDASSSNLLLPSQANASQSSNPVGGSPKFRQQQKQPASNKSNRR